MIRRRSDGRSARSLGLAIAWVSLSAIALQGCGGSSTRDAEKAHDDHDDHHEEEETARGSRGGRLFERDGLGLELLIAEEGIPPEYRAYLYDEKGAQLPRVEGTLYVILERFGGRRDSIPFRAEGDRFRGTKTVEEPHSFTARIVLERGGARREWTYTQHEGRVALSPEAIERARLKTAPAGPREIAVGVETPGEVRLNGEAVVQVHPRYAGVVRRLAVRLGDTVKKGDLVAVVQSNESLADYEITAPIGGTVVNRETIDGQSVDHESILCTIADLSTVWVDFALYPQIAGKVRRGQHAMVRAATTENGLEASGTVSYVGPLLEQDTRVSYGRIVLPNPQRRWQPGLYVTVKATVERVRALVAVPEEAIVRTSRGAAVFRAAGTEFELQPVVPGRTDGRWTEITEGLAPGDAVVVANAYLLKAELGKSEATHDH
jgi:cobalt-zinc-cadmium efflux system membrane fusion protein